MEREQATPTVLYGGERGAGGKFRKPPARKPPVTPYDRPPANQSQTAAQQRDGGGWLSKLVDPACRLIAGGATRIFPSFFSKSPSTAALPPSDTEDHEKWGTDVKQNADDDDKKCTLNLGISNSTEGAGPSKSANRLNSNSGFDELGQDRISNSSADNEFSKIEQLMKGKSFSRDEINRLTEILNSRVVDFSNVDQEKKKPSMITGGQAEGAVLACENPRMSTEEKQEDLNRAILGTSTPLPQSTMIDEVGASPVDIAKAYMGSRASEVGIASKSIMSKDERALLQCDEFASKPFIPSPSPKASVCWPGAMVQDQCGYLTPQSQRGRLGLHNFPRTPYSRTIYSKSKSKLTQLQAVDNRCLNISSTPLQQSQTPIYGQVKSRSNVLNDGYGSVGPVRRIRPKFVSEAPPRGSVSFHTSQNGPLQVENSSVFKGFLPAIKKNLEPGATSSTSEFQSVGNMTNSSEVGVPTLQTSSGQAVRAILEHLDRNKPTPKEKSAELKLATAWKKPSSSKVTDVMSKEHTSLPHLGGFDSHKNMDLAGQKVSAQGKERNTNEATAAVNKDIEASSRVIGDTSLLCDGNARSSVDFKRTHDSQFKSTEEKASMGFPDSRQKGTTPLWPIHNQINGQDAAKMVPSASGSGLLKNPPLQPSGTKPILTSISVDKPDPRQTFSSDNNSGFTFPVSASSGVLSEPPTPSILPSFSASGLCQPKEGPTVPSYSFGTKRSTPPLVFSFPSTSSASTPDNASDLKFNFGSDKKTRVSFRSVGNDAICY